ncbi:MAG TPA: ATP-grasp domain-containing protein [Thermoanaerobaculia bacterium]|nr:ATP-grasp domain-containing protein [Thermoanaerobaculia bacterium]
MPRVLLLLPTSTYRTADYLHAAARLGVETVVGSERPSTLERLNPAGLMTIDFRDARACERAASELASRGGVDAVLGVDEETALAAARIARTLGIARANPPEAVAAARDKRLFRERMDAAGLAAPRWRAEPLEAGADAVAARVRLPCVVKPTFLSGSRGVIRADSPDALRAAWERLAAILADPEVARRGGENAQTVLVEEFVPGDEVAVEGLLTAGELEVLAIFDKPDPLDGPFFEETIYVTPSRRSAEVRAAIARAAGDAAKALGLVHGPIHAELRLPPSGPVVLEIAARTIGGLCGRALRFAEPASSESSETSETVSLEEVVLRHALGRGVPPPREEAASGVMMIPTPRAGILEEVRHLAAARAVPDVEDVIVSAHPGQRLVPLPEGSRYLGFVFARAATPERAERALRAANAALEIRITPGEG